MYDDNTILSFGKYKFTALCRVPSDYLLRIYKSGHYTNLSPELKEYIESNIEVILLRKQGIISPALFEFPCLKTTYPTENDAKKVLKQVRQIIQKHKKPIRAYACEKCGGWHLTSMPLEVWNNKG